MMTGTTLHGPTETYGKLRRMLVWLMRIGRCRGFGIQSPWAYRMVRYVINEHYPYYGYSRLRAEWPDADAVKRKLCELCLRLANCMQPDVVVDFSGDDGAFAAYLKAGCRKARCVRGSCGMSGDTCAELTGSGTRAVLVHVVPQGDFSRVLSHVCANARPGWAVMIDGIHGGKEAGRLWKNIVEELPGVVTFDLYYCGLVFFDDRRYKQNYIINF